MNSFLILLIFCITTYGISNHFVYAHGPFHLYDKIREKASKIHKEFGELFNCFICFPTWVGIIASISNYLFVPNIKITPFMMLLYGAMPWWIIMILDGFFTSGICWLINTWQENLERENQNG